MLETYLAELEPLLSLFGDSPSIRSIATLLLVFVAARLAQWIVRKGIHRIAVHTRSTLDDQIIALIHQPIFWTVMLIGVLAAARLGSIPASMLPLLGSIAASVLIFLWMVFALRASRLVIHALSRRGGENRLVRQQTQPLFTNVMAVLVVVLSIYFMFQAWQIDMTAWLASAGIAGIAIGFAAKDTLANLFSGVFILADSPYKLGDYVVLDHQERGKITHIGIRSTRLLTRDDVEVTVPNSVMSNSKIINESGGPYKKYRIRVQVGVAYGSDIDHVEAVLMRVAGEQPLVCAEPEPRVRFRTFGASSLDYELLCWVDEPELRGKALHHLNSAVYKAFNAERIEIPFAQQDVHIKELPGQTPAS